jgi:hypothetical protein
MKIVAKCRTRHRTGYSRRHRMRHLMRHRTNKRLQLCRAATSASTSSTSAKGASMVRPVSSTSVLAPSSAPTPTPTSTGSATTPRQRDYLLSPPRPPVMINRLTATDPTTPAHILWDIARTRPDLRFWLIANPHASPELLEFLSQVGGPGVERGLRILLDSS